MLFQFFAGYFHEDFRLEATDVLDIVDRYSAEVTPEQRSRLGDAIVQYCEENSIDEELAEKLYRELGCYYDPTPDGVSARDWLQSIALRLAYFQSHAKDEKERN
jgi:hypothetical protein